MWRVALVIAFSMVVTPLVSRAQETTVIDPGSSDPSPEIDKDPACAAMRADVRQAFASNYDLSVLPAQYGDSNGINLFADFSEEIPAYGNPLELPENGRESVYACFLDNSQCGGFCYAQGLVLYPKPANGSDLECRATNAGKEAILPDTAGWSIRRSSAGVHYAMAVVNGKFEAYRIGLPGIARLVCRIPIKSDVDISASDPSLVQAKQALGDLAAAVRGISRPGGYCGRANTDLRWDAQITNSFDEALFRPWAYLQPLFKSESGNSHFDYTRIEASLRDWSLGGLSEFKAFNDYQITLDRVSSSIAAFYHDKLRWPADKAKARQVLTTAIARGLGFNAYDPYAERSWERDLRAAILEHKPISEIRLISGDFKSRGVQESTLDIAVVHPEALIYLLQNGADPNQENPFGKTPLMYAAQYNQLESVKRLLKAGADPNAATRIPSDQCGYSLETSGMTALHYAVRYASPEVVSALVDGGAVLFAKSTHWKRGAETPLDWLRRYTASGPERNPNITDEAASQLLVSLAPPDPQALAGIVRKLTLKAEAQANSGDMDGAYSSLESALVASPNDEKALSNMALVGVKSGHPQVALDASDRMIAEGSTPAIKAAAWFNHGLACEKLTEPLFRSDYSWYCSGDRIVPFLKSWDLAPSTGRMNKVRQVLSEGGLPTCTVTHNGQEFRFIVQSDREAGTVVHRLYFIHATGSEFHPEDISFSKIGPHSGISAAGRPIPGPSAPQRSVDYALGTETLSLFESRAEPGAVTIFGQTCSGQ